MVLFKDQNPPESKPIGWTKFELKAKDFPIPIFAIGGLTKTMLEKGSKKRWSRYFYAKGCLVDGVAR